jgi:ribosomal protein S18 acetylase RimI-like enzyme
MFAAQFAALFALETGAVEGIVAGFVLAAAFLVAVGTIWRLAVKPVVARLRQADQLMALAVEHLPQIPEMRKELEDLRRVGDIVDLLRDESVEDVQEMLRRGKLPWDPLRDD